MSFALDANVLLYASNTASPEHMRARDFLSACARGTELLCLGWPTLMAYLRISTHPAIFPTPLSQGEAEGNIHALLQLPHVRVVSELDGFWEVYREVSATTRARGNLVPDAHLAAILKQNGIATLCTNDSDFRRFDFLELRNPFSP